MKSLIDRLEKIFINNYLILFLLFYIIISILTFMLFKINVEPTKGYAFVILALYCIIIFTIISSLNKDIIKDLVLIGFSASILLLFITRNYNVFLLELLFSMNLSTIWIRKYHDLVININESDPTSGNELIEDNSKKSLSLWFSDTYYPRYIMMKVTVSTILYFGGIFLISKFFVEKILEIIGQNSVVL